MNLQTLLRVSPFLYLLIFDDVLGIKIGPGHTSVNNKDMVSSTWACMLQPCTCTSEHLFYKTKDVHSQKPTHKCFISFIHNSPKLEATVLPSNEGWVEQSVVHPHRGILHSSTQECTIDKYNHLDESPENYAE